MASKDLQLEWRGERLPYQIFPESLEDADEIRLKQQNPGAQRGRLPSIVVDPTLVSEEESSSLQWPVQRCVSNEDEEKEDSFQDQCVSQTSILHSGENGNKKGSQEGRVHIKSSSAAVRPVLVDYSRLTPPPSPTTPEVAPPCFRS